VIQRRVPGLKPPRPFWYWDKGDFAIVGRTYAVADLRFLRFAGFPAWVVWAIVHIYFLIGFANRFFVLLQWGLAYVTKRRQVRIFPNQAEREEPGADHELEVPDGSARRDG
jgi:NADH dehydrogenase